MATFNAHIALGEPALPGKGIEKALQTMAAKDERIVAVLEDMGFPGIDWWTTNLPDRMCEVGIAEQNGAVVAAALAAEGFVPVIYSFLFANMGRAFNQVRQSILVDRFNVKFIGREGAWGEVGVSHNTVECMAACRVLPNLVIMNPADVVEAEKATEAMLQYVGPVLIRQESSPTPMTIFSADYPFDIGKAYVVKDGKDATIIATGYMLTEAIKAIDLLEKDGLDVGIVNMCTIKPIDEDAIVAAAEAVGRHRHRRERHRRRRPGRRRRLGALREAPHAAGQGGRRGRVQPVGTDPGREGRPEGALRPGRRRPRLLGQGVHREEAARLGTSS